MRDDPEFTPLTVRIGFGMAALLAVAWSLPAAAQQVQAQAQNRAPAKQAPPAQAKAAPAEAAATGDSALRQRVEQLEEQLVDMQVVIGTLESMAKGGTASASGVYRGPAAGNSGDDTRMAALEQQIRSLQSQVEQLTQQLRTQGARGPAPQVASNVATAPAPGAFGSTTVQPERDPIGQIIGSANTPGSPTPTPAFPQATASDASSKQMYETAYSYLLNQDYASAETAFDEFLRRYPNDTLAGNAQYWLGESFFVRGQFKPAANAFLKGYQTYGRSSKAPDSLLKLAMSLDRLGQRDAACSSYGELTVKFPNAPGSVKSRADNERRRLGCA